MAAPDLTGIGIPQTNLRPQTGLETNPRYFDIQSGEIGESFANFLGDAIQSVDSSMKSSEAKVQDFVTGKTDNMHDVMISMQQSQLSFQMMVEIRNKVIETYQELSRMQV